MTIKTILISLLALTGIAQVSYAQDTTVQEKSDTSWTKDIHLGVGKQDTETKKDIKYPRTYGGITFTRIDWGFSRLSDNGSFTLSEGNQFMSYKKASNFGFDVAQFGVRFNDQFKIYLSTGFEWNYLRLKQNVLLLENVSPLTHEPLDEGNNYSKNVFTSTYLRVPLTFEWRSAKLSNGERVKIAFGAMTGVLLKGTQRLKSDGAGKQKFKDTYNLQTFQYGPFIRLGYDDFGLFAKYYVNDMFEKSPAQEGLRNLTFGLTLGF